MQLAVFSRVTDHSMIQCLENGIKGIRFIHTGAIVLHTGNIVQVLIPSKRLRF